MIDERLDALAARKAASDRFPHLRVCQLISNATTVSDPYYITDKQLEVALREYVERNGEFPR